MEVLLSNEVEAMFSKQLRQWEMPQKNYAQLTNLLSRQIELNGLTALLQFNTERIRSAAAKTDRKSLKERSCFLCEGNRPPEQEKINYKDRYDILINPFPIFRRHLTIASRKHIPQLIDRRFEDMADLAAALQDYVIFYNGAKCGASAPDHMHFQAGNKGLIPLEVSFGKLSSLKKEIYTEHGAVLYELNSSSFRCLIIESADRDSLSSLFYKVKKVAASLKSDEEEPMMNLLCWFDHDHWVAVIFLRRAHRPRQFFAEDETNILISPASVEMGGLFVLPLEKDFNKIRKEDLEDILNQTLVTTEELNTVIQQL